MIPRMPHRPALLLGVLLLAGCSSFYESYGFGGISAPGIDVSSATPLELPENAPSISQRFRPEGNSSKSEHKGFDILVPSGTPVLAAASGVVSRTQVSVLYGRQVMIDHGVTADGFPIQTRYFHLSARSVEVGDRLERGQVIGLAGLSGLAGGYPHLHFEVHRMSNEDPPVAVKFIDPQLFWVEGVGKVTCYDSGRDWPEQPAALTYPVPCRGVAWE